MAILIPTISSTGSVSFTNPGPFSWTVPSGVTRLNAVLTGAGGGGGSPANITLTDSTNQENSSVGNYTWTLAITPTWNTGYSVTLISFSVSLAAALSGANITMYVFNSSGSALWSYSWANVSPNAGWFTTPTINLALTSGNTYYLGWCSSVYWTFNTDSATSQTVSDNSVGENLSVNINAGYWGSSCAWPVTSSLNNFTWYLQLKFAVALGIGGGGGGAINLIGLIPVLPGQTVTGTVGAGGTSGLLPTAGGNTTLTVGSTTWTANGGGPASSSGPGTGGAASAQTGVLLSADGQSGIGLSVGSSGGAPGSLLNLAGGAFGWGATTSLIAPASGAPGYVYWTNSNATYLSRNGLPGSSPGGGGAGGGQANGAPGPGTGEGGRGGDGGAALVFLNASGSPVAIYTYQTAGSYVIPVPANASSLRATLIGAGGGGGGGTTYAAGGGGGGGACVDVTAPVGGMSSVMVTVGAGGAGGLSQGDSGGPTAGGAGGATTLTVGSNQVSAAGGAGGGAASTSANTGGAGGSGGVALTSVPSGWTLNASYAGGNGATGAAGSSYIDGNGPGGGAGGNASAGESASTPGSGSAGTKVAGGAAGTMSNVSYPAGPGGGGAGSYNGGNGFVTIWW